MDLDGGDARQLTKNAGGPRDKKGRSPADLSPAWSPDGRAIVFVRRRAPRPGAVAEQDLWRVDVATGREQRLTRTDADESEPAWSRDGRSLGFFRQFLSYRPGDLMVANADASSARILVDGNSFGGVSWSPDGREIAFTKLLDLDRWAGFAVNVRTGQERRLTTRRGVQPSWSPDGRWLAFHDTAQGEDRVFVQRSDGGAAALVARNACCPDWQP
jgi:Tol biopolymer transport system component